MKVGIAYSNTRDGFDSGKAAADDAIRTGSIDKPDLAMAFCSGKLDHKEFLRGIQDKIGNTPVIGGSAIGIITNNNLSYDGFPSGVAIFQLDKIKYQIASIGGIDKDANTAGYNLIRKISTTQEDKLMLMFYDSIKIPAFPISPPVINPSSPLIDGIRSILQADLPIIGAGLIGDYEFSKTQQFCGFNVLEQSLVGALFSGPVNVKIHVSMKNQ